MRARLSPLLAAHLATRLMGRPVKQVAPMLLRRYGGDNPASHAWGNRFPPWPTLANLRSNGCYFPAIAALLAAVTTREERASAASLQYAANNLAIGVGAILGGFIVSTTRPSSFTAIYLIDAGTFVAFGVLMTLLVPLRPAPRAADRA